MTSRNEYGRPRTDEGRGAAKIVFEGSYPIVLTPALINLLREARDSMRANVPWFVEGPVFPDPEDPRQRI